MRKKILVVGSLNMDMTLEMKEMPSLGETILGSSLKYAAGGKGANQAYAAGSLGENISMLGCVGDDDFGRAQAASLGSRGVDVSGLKITREKTTGVASIYVDSRGDNSIVVIPGANMECDVAYLQEKEEAIKECDYILLQMEIPYESICYAVNKAHEFGKTVILNPAPAPDSIADEVLCKLDYITPNETELLKMVGGTELDVDSMKQYARVLLKKGVKNVLVTLGERGSLLVNDSVEQVYEAKKVRAVDTTAAGDCFNGAFLVGLAEGMAVGDAIEFANAASAIAVTRKGAQDSIPTREEVDATLGK